MELVYLWVEEYKNVKKQGFNFSPRFECEFKDEYDDKGKIKDNCELIIKEKKDYVSIFPDNINVTAIVGKNGSGKSSIGEVLRDIFINSKLNNRKNHILLYRKNNGDNFCDSSIHIKNNNLNCIYKKINKDLRLYLSQDSYSKDMMIDRHKVFSVSSSEKSTINSLLNNKIINTSDSFEITSFMYIPKKIKIELKDIEVMMNESILKEIGGWRYLSDNSFLEAVKKTIVDAFSNKYYQYLAYTYITYAYEEKDEDFTYNIQDQKILVEILKEKKLFLEEKSFDKISNGIDTDLSQLDEDTKNIIQNGNCLECLDIDFTDEEDRNYNNLSSGEKQIFGQLLNIYFYSHEHTNNQLYFLDEPDNMLHPNWQKSYVKELYTLLKKLKINFHFILATHSPFLLSDLPKENVIFLEKEEKTGNCINASDKVDLNPFGANIHTLLSHGFFMKDGLMGEFAKEKINTAIKYLNQTKLSEKELEYCENIISIIGEPIIKRQLQKMLDSKRLKKVDKIDDIEKQILKLSQELKSLKND